MARRLNKDQDTCRHSKKSCSHTKKKLQVTRCHKRSKITVCKWLVNVKCSHNELQEYRIKKYEEVTGENWREVMEQFTVQ